ncbi:transporter [Acinetobacter baumannii]|uniref:SphA family protein n=1 Tax=Acinetobacter baumannii TaxID=470 RepID=UPI0038B65EE6
MNHYSKIVLASVLFGHTAQVFATENGSDTFPLGAEGVMVGALPPQGVYLLNYYQSYHASRFEGGPQDFHVDVNAYVPRLVWVTEQNYFGGQLGFYAVQPLVDVRLNVNGQADSNSGLADLAIGSMLGWHKGNHHWVGALEAVLETGQYDKPTANKPVVANIGKNYSTIRPVFAYSYSQPNGFDLSTKISYSFNTENDDTNYKSGEYFAGDYSVGYAVHDKVRVALEGYAFKQTTPDEVQGVKIGNKGQVLALGPAIQYHDKNWSLEAKYLKETEVENRPKGHTTLLKFVWAF